MYKELFSCKNKVALITGGAGLIGREIAKGLQDFNAIVYIADKSEDAAKKLTDNTGIRFINLDIAEEISIKNAVDKIVQAEGRIDVLVNSAYPRTSDWGVKLEQISAQSWTENLNAHLGGYFLACRIVAEHMKNNGGGSIINFASIYGSVGPNFSIYEDTSMTMPAAYSAIKGGIIAFSIYLATYYAKNNIRVNSISPGGIYDNQPGAFVEKYSRKTPLGRMAKPAEIVGGTIYLASDASSYVTGHNLIIDGGWTAW
jgi:NAD(P)-dependent dehydrogenase (short-subunit alcohol dehydrogenase family)